MTPQESSPAFESEGVVPGGRDWLPGIFWTRAMANDHRLDIYVDATTYMALKQRASDVDRSISQHIRFLIKQDMLQALTEERNFQVGTRGNGGKDRNEG